MFDGFFTRIGTVMGLGARHGRRGFPREEHGIAIPVWGDPASKSDASAPTAAETKPATGDAQVTPIRSGGAHHG